MKPLGSQKDPEHVVHSLSQGFSEQIQDIGQKRAVVKTDCFLTWRVLVKRHYHFTNIPWGNNGLKK